MDLDSGFRIPEPPSGFQYAEIQDERIVFLKFLQSGFSRWTVPKYVHIKVSYFEMRAQKKLNRSDLKFQKFHEILADNDVYRMISTFVWLTCRVPIWESTRKYYLCFEIRAKRIWTVVIIQKITLNVLDIWEDANSLVA